MKQVGNLIAIGVLIFGLIVGCSVRFANLGQVPHGVYVDETSIGENAFLINKFGLDEWGEHTPIFFKAFGEYKNPIFIYTTSWLFSIASPSVYLLRLSASIWGLVTILLTAWAVYEITSSKWWGALAALLITLMPWHIHSSRVVFEAVTYPAFMALILGLIAKFIKTKSSAWLAVCAFAIGVSFYSYTAARLFTPVFALVLAIAATYVKNWKHGIFVICIVFIELFPAINFEIENPGSLLARYQAVASRDLSKIVTTYLHQFDYKLWFVSGDHNLRHTPARGMVPLTLILPFIMGVTMTSALEGSVVTEKSAFSFVDAEAIVTAVSNVYLLVLFLMTVPADKVFDAVVRL